jgi:hypothetical protein
VRLVEQRADLVVLNRRAYIAWTMASPWASRAGTVAFTVAMVSALSVADMSVPLWVWAGK